MGVKHIQSMYISIHYTRTFVQNVKKKKKN